MQQAWHLGLRLMDVSTFEEKSFDETHIDADDSDHHRTWPTCRVRCSGNCQPKWCHIGSRYTGEHSRLERQTDWRRDKDNTRRLHNAAGGIGEDYSAVQEIVESTDRPGCHLCRVLSRVGRTIPGH